MSKEYQNKEWLYQNYVNEGRSMSEIGKMCGVGTGTVHYFVHKYDIPIKPNRTLNQFINPLYNTSTVAFKTCPDCNTEFSATEKHFYKQSGNRKTFRKRCKACHQVYSKEQSDLKGYNKNAAGKTFKKVTKDYKTTKCMLCSVGLEPKKWIRHHVNYPEDKMVLICRACHNWLHGRSAYRHVFKEQYPPDLAVWHFVSNAYKLYFEHDPRMDEIVKVNIKTGKEIE